MTSADFMYAGTFGRADWSDTIDTAFGIYVLRLDPVSGQLSAAGMTPTPRPGWLALHPSRHYLYAVNEVHEFEGQPGGGVSAFAIEKATGQLRPLNTRPTGADLPWAPTVLSCMSWTSSRAGLSLAPNATHG